MNSVTLREEIQRKSTKELTLTANQRLQVTHYAEWLAAQSRRNTTATTIQEIQDYAESAGKTILVGKRPITIFAPFRSEHSALQTFTTWQVVAFGVLVLLWTLGLLFFRQETLLATTTAFTLLYLSHLVLNIVLAFSVLRHPFNEQIDEPIIAALQDADWPSYTILCPLYREAQVVPQFVEAMQNLSYPTDKLQILLLTEQEDAETRNAIRALCLPAHFKVVTVPDGSPRTKPRACNYGLMQATGQYVVIYDAEDIPEPLQLKKAVLTFAKHGPNLGCVQARLNFYNPEQNLLTRWFTAEYSLWFDLILPGLQKVGLSIPLGGTSNHFPTKTLRALGAWDAFNVTEDCDLGLRLARYRLDTVVLNSVTYEEANSQTKNWIRQRSRWIKGYMQTYLVNMRRPIRHFITPRMQGDRTGRLREFLSLQLVIGSKMAVLYLNPFLWLSFVLYIFLRPTLGEGYQVLFPKPLLYIGSLSLILGNFFYIYIYLLACLRRKQYQLIKWMPLIPLYWMMMSVAAFMALWQLLVKPHYWEKTEHGLHLRNNRSGLDVASLNMSQSIADEQTQMMPALFSRRGNSSLSSVTASLRAIVTLPMPALSSTEPVIPCQPKGVAIKDFWLFLTLLIASNASVAAYLYYFHHTGIMLYSDAYSHLRVARRVFDGAHISFAQLGGVWLPLPHLLMLPFIWNDYLWRTGLAGTIPAMACYLVSTIYLFLSARRLTGNSAASFAGSLVFILNPNILYLQTTPLSELVCIATFTMACYYFLAWAQEDQAKFLVLAAGSTFLATLARYDSWCLFPTLLALIIVIGWIKHHPWEQVEGNLIVFGILAGLGIALWLFWCTTIFGDPLYFQHSTFSSQAQQVPFLQANTLYTYHDLLQSFRYYTLDSIDILGPLLFVLAAMSIVKFVSQHRFTAETVGALVFLVPFFFYIVSLYSGQAILYIPEAVPTNAPQHLFNVRYGAEIVAPAALFIATLANQLKIPSLGHLGKTLGHVTVVLVIITQAALVVSGGIITVQDGQYGVSCAAQHDINIYLAQHYAGGRILDDIFASGIDGVDSGIDFKDFINESSGPLWTDALYNPASKVDWIILRPKSNLRPDDVPDLVAQNVDTRSPSFLAQFSLVVQEPTGLELYHRIGQPLPPPHPIPPHLLTEHSLCGAGGS